MNVTVNPEDAVATSGGGGEPFSGSLLNGPKVIVWGSNTVKVCVTGVAAAYVVLPVWLAVIEHVPSVNSVTVAADNVQIVGLLEAKVTANPELAVAVKANGKAPKVCPLGAANVMV